MAIDSIPARLLETARRQPNAPACYTRTRGEWRATSWRAYVEEILRAARALIALGLQPGDTTCILGFNRPEWVIFDLATMCAGGAPAGIYATCSPPEVQYIVHHTEARVILVEDAEQWAKIHAERHNLPHLQHVVFMRGAQVPQDPLAIAWEQLLDRAEEVEEAAVRARIDALQDDQLATLIYTSGTTGPPKGVMLSHRNLAWTAREAVQIADMRSTDFGLSYLPLSHIAEQVFTIHGPVTVGASVYFAESIARVPDNLKEVQPTVFFAVPRIWEKFHAGITAKAREASPLKRRLLEWARGVGREVSALRMQGREPSGLLAVQYRAADRLVFSRLKAAIGLGRAKMCVVGAAPIATEILEFMASLDVIVHEVYGQSEDTGPTSFNQRGNTRFGTVGPPFPGVEVRLGEDAEILVRGPNVFLGYYKDPEATAATLIDGWLHSGDLGAFDKEGFLKITGRKKEILITAGGKNIAPKNIEVALKNHPLVTEAVVVGDRRRYLTALLTVDPEATRHLDADALRAELQRGVDEANTLFARVEQIKKFAVLPRQLTLEDGELTPTLKVKRRVVYEHFAPQIEAMYADDAEGA